MLQHSEGCACALVWSWQSWAPADPGCGAPLCPLLMAPAQMSRGKRLGKPLLFGAVLLGLGTAFINRHMFLTDVEELRAKEREKYEAKRCEVEEARQRQLAELAERKKKTE